MYDELVKALRRLSDWSIMDFEDNLSYANQIADEAADAIEELSKRVDESIPKDDAEIIIAEVAKPQWIPVTERLPEMHENVLICNDDYGKTELGFSTVAVWDGSDWVNAWDGEGTICCVTHWMPLPEPPKEK